MSTDCDDARRIVMHRYCNKYLSLLSPIYEILGGTHCWIFVVARMMKLYHMIFSIWWNVVDALHLMKQYASITLWLLGRTLGICCYYMKAIASMLIPSWNRMTSKMFRIPPDSCSTSSNQCKLKMWFYVKAWIMGEGGGGGTPPRERVAILGLFFLRLTLDFWINFCK